ncbi:MAG: AAA family ATPase [Roseibium sp.]|nr:AAA family ATPase [Roseibium sp.]
MKFGELKIEKFLTIEEAVLNLSDRGLILVQGVNDDDTSADSNGAGKSSLADAFCWCTYGTTARGESGDNVINNKFGKGTRVSIDVVDGVDEWRISRHRKHKEHKNSLRVEKLNAGGTWDDHTLGTDKLTQGLVNQIMGCSYEVFSAAVYAGQERMPDLPAMTDKQLKILVEEAAGVTVLEAAYTEARKELTDAKGKFTAQETKIDRLNDRQEVLTDNLTDLKAQSDDWEKRHKENLEDHRVKHNDLVKIAKGAIAEVEKLDIEGQRTKIAGIDAKIAAVADENKQAKELQAEAAAADREYAIKKQTYDAAKKHHQREQDALAKVDDLVGKPCGECGKPYCEHDLSDARERAEKRVSDAKKSMDGARTAAVDAQDRKKTSVEASERFQASMTDVSSENALRASYSDVLNDMLAQERDAQQRRKHVAESKTAFQRLKEAENPHKNQIEATEKKISTLKDQIEEERLEFEALGEKVKVAETVASVFSPAGVRAYILDEVTPFLNAQTAKYLGALSDGNLTATWSTLQKNKKGELKEKFSIDVVNAKGGTSFGLISGGERRKVRIASALALQDLVARRATKPISLFVGDEIDDALDTAGQERLMGILDEKARERGTVLVISHNDLKDWISQQVLVQKSDRGGSVITEVMA